MPRSLRFLFSCFLFGFGAVALLEAQAQKAAISGTVSDATGAVLAGASIQVRNVGTGVIQTAASNDASSRIPVPDAECNYFRYGRGLRGSSDRQFLALQSGRDRRF